MVQSFPEDTGKSDTPLDPAFCGLVRKSQHIHRGNWHAKGDTDILAAT